MRSRECGLPNMNLDKENLGGIVMLLGKCFAGVKLIIESNQDSSYRIKSSHKAHLRLMTTYSNTLEDTPSKKGVQSKCIAASNLPPLSYVITIVLPKL